MPSSKPAKSPLFINSVQKAFGVLENFTRDEPRQSLKDIASLNEMDKSSAQRFSYTLEKLGYLHKDERTKTYSLTSKALELTYHFLQASPLVAVSLPFLRHLHHETGETINLSVLEGTDIRFILRLPGTNILSTDVVVGSRLPAFCTASGLSMLAQLEPADAEERLRQSDLVAYTERTVVAMPALLGMVSEARRTGYSVVASGYFNDDVSVAVALPPRGGRQMASISIGATAARYTEDEARSRFLPLLHAAQRAILA